MDVEPVQERTRGQAFYLGGVSAGKIYLASGRRLLSELRKSRQPAKGQHLVEEFTTSSKCKMRVSHCGLQVSNVAAYFHIVLSSSPFRTARMSVFFTPNESREQTRSFWRLDHPHPSYSTSPSS